VALRPRLSTDLPFSEVPGLLDAGIRDPILTCDISHNAFRFNVLPSIRQGGELLHDQGTGRA